MRTGSLTFVLFRIIEELMKLGKAAGCYKVILDCSEKNVGFYKKCGFEQKEVCMAWYIRK
jgi:glucosamine-phosphate N-acetyltransferase